MKCVTTAMEAATSTTEQVNSNQDVDEIEAPAEKRRRISPLAFPEGVASTSREVPQTVRVTPRRSNGVEQQAIQSDIIILIDDSDSEKESPDSQFKSGTVYDRTDILWQYTKNGEGYFTNALTFECSICYTIIMPTVGCVIQNCRHKFCVECITKTIIHCDNTEVNCPYYDDNIKKCLNFLLDDEIKGILTTEQYEKHLLKLSDNVKSNTTETSIIGADYKDLLQLEQKAGYVSNVDEFECIICFSTILPYRGCVLRNCLHKFCYECITSTIMHSETIEVKCPFMTDVFMCELHLQDREIRGLLSAAQLEMYLTKSLSKAEMTTTNSFHCKFPNCVGWWICEDMNISHFTCPVCNNNNCIKCAAIHPQKTCKEYQEECIQNKIDQQTQTEMKKRIQSGKVMKCPKCGVFIEKRDGCDAMKCAICHTELCWATKGPRWGPNGHGDISGGCRCGVNRKRCHPKCRGCH